MQESLLLQNYLTSLATSGTVLPRKDCPMCGALLFKGYAQFLEIKCRSCKAMNLFDGEEVKTYNPKPY